MPQPKKSEPPATTDARSAPAAPRVEPGVVIDGRYRIVSPLGAGGIGTVLEATMVWQLLQVGHLEDKPLVLVGGMWSDLLAWAHTHLLDPRLPLVSAEDLSIPRCVATGAEAIEVLRADHARWRRAEEGAHPPGP